MSDIAKDFWKTLNQGQRDFLLSGGPLEGNTDAEKVADAKRRLLDGFVSGSVPLNSDKVSEYSKSVTSKPYLYSAENVLATLGGGSATDTTGAKVDPREALVQRYDALDDLSRMAYRHNFENDYGRGSWQNVRKVVDNSRKDVEELSSAGEKGTIGDAIQSIFFPRTHEARKNGREPSGKDYALDAIENLLMLAPLGTVAALPKVYRAGKAARVLAGLGAAAAVPHVAEAVDAISYSPEENPDRSVYSEADALIGTATNAAVPYMLRKAGTSLARKAGAKMGAETKGLSDEMAAQVDDLARQGYWKKPTEETVDAVRKKDLSKEAGKLADEATDGALTRFHEGGEEALTDMEIQRLVSIGDDIYNKRKKPTAGQYLEAGFLQKRSDDLGVRPGALLDFPDEVILTGKGTGAQKYSDAIRDIVAMKKGLAEADVFDALKYRNPKANLALDAIMEYASNRYGSDKDAGVLAGAVNSLVPVPGFDAMDYLHTWKDEAVKGAKAKAEKSMAERVVDSLPSDGLTEEDSKYLALVREKPGVLKGIGAEAQDPKFRNWLMLRGTDILRGTPLHRPTPLVR